MKARKVIRRRVPVSQWEGLIKEWDDDKAAFRLNHPEIKNPQQRISNWRKSILKKLEKESEVEQD